MARSVGLGVSQVLGCDKYRVIGASRHSFSTFISIFSFLIGKGIIDRNVHGLSDWGLDFFWCALAEKFKVGKIDCIIVPLVHMLHMDTQTISDENRTQWNSSVAEQWYEKQARKLGIHHRFNEAQALIPINLVDIFTIHVASATE